MSFPQTDCELRTNSSFRNRQDPIHHRGQSLLEELPIDMVDDFVIADPLHLLDLGIMRKLIRIWIEGTSTKYFKLTKRDKIKLDKALLLSNSYLPSEIHRSVRPIEWLKFWKGNEYRTVLMYIGIAVFKEILPVDAYNHFLCLFCAVTICSSGRYTKYVRLAKVLFDEYIQVYIDLYGRDAITINVHNLCHVSENVERFGHLNSISTYPFENAARHIKLKLKQCDKPIEQAARRILESGRVNKSDKRSILCDTAIFASKTMLFCQIENTVINIL